MYHILDISKPFETGFRERQGALFMEDEQLSQELECWFFGDIATAPTLSIGENIYNLKEMRKKSERALNVVNSNNHT